MGGGAGPQIITFTLLVSLEDLDESSEQEIRDQILDLLEELGAGIVEFEPFKEGSTIVTVRSKTPIAVDTINNKITEGGNIFTITYTDIDDASKKHTAVISKVDDINLAYTNDLILIDNDNVKHYAIVGDDGNITTEIVNNTLPQRNIQCVICGGKATKIDDYNPEKYIPPFYSIDSLNSVNLGNVEYIGFLSFQNCNNIKNINFGIVKTIRELAFSLCTSLKEIDLQEVTTLGSYSFDTCIQLSKVKLNVIQDWTIPNNCFNNCKVVYGTTTNPFLVEKNITNLSFGSNNGLFSDLNTGDNLRDLKLVDYLEDPNYKRVFAHQRLTFKLQVALEELTPFSIEQIQKQIINLLDPLGEGKIEFDPFSTDFDTTLVTAISEKQLSVDEIKSKIIAEGNIFTILYTNNEDATLENTAIISNFDNEDLVYNNDLILIDTDNQKHYANVGQDGIITREIVNNKLPNRNIQCVICGGNAKAIENGTIIDGLILGVFTSIPSLTSVNLGTVKEYVGNVAFFLCQNLKNVDFRNVSKINFYSFYYCQLLKKIDLKNVVGIEQLAFSFCLSLNTVRLNKRQNQTISTYAFQRCLVVNNTEQTPFLVNKYANPPINNLSFGAENGEFSNKQIGPNSGDLQLISYPGDNNYLRVTVRP